jgi:Skp family chaperone for outer membrane proteins
MFRTISLHYWISIIAIAIAIAAAAYSAGNRRTSSRTAIGFIDFQQVVLQSDAGKSIRELVDPKRVKLQQEAEEKLKEFKKEQEEIKKNDDKEGMVRLQKKIEAWNARAQKQQAELNDSVAPAIQKLEEALRAQVEDIAEDNKLRIIFPMQSAFFAHKGLDVTPEAIRRINKVLPKIDAALTSENAGTTIDKK